MKHKIFKSGKEINLLPFNRDAKLRSSLVESMRENGFILPIVLVWTTAISGVRELFILDGQHRYLSAIYLNIPFDAVILEEEPDTKKRLVNLVALYNNSAKPWSTIDYTKAYASLGDENYVTLERLSKTQPYSVGALATMLTGSLRTAGGGSHDVKMGTFKVKALNSSMDTLKIAQNLNVKIGGRMLMALHKCRLTNDNFDQVKFKNFIEANHSELRQKGFNDYFLVFNEIF